MSSYCQAKLITAERKCQNYTWHSKYCERHASIAEKDSTRIQDWVEHPFPTDPIQAYLDYQTQRLARRGHSGLTVQYDVSFNISGNLVVSDMYDLSPAGIFNPTYDAICLHGLAQGDWRGALYNAGTSRMNKTALLMVKEGQSFYPDKRWGRVNRSTILVKQGAIMVFATSVWEDKEAFAQALMDYKEGDKSLPKVYSDGFIYSVSPYTKYEVLDIQNENYETIAFQVLPPKNKRSWFRNE